MLQPVVQYYASIKYRVQSSCFVSPRTSLYSVPALEALRETIPSLETLGNERDQGANGNAFENVHVLFA